MKNIIMILAIILMLNVNTSMALSPSVISIEDISDEFTFNYSNIVYSQIKTIDLNDKITRIKITLNDKDNNSGVKLTFPDNISYTALTSKYSYLGIFPYKNATHFLTFTNETVNYSYFKESKNYNTIISANSEILIEYNINTGFTTISFSPNGNFVDILKNHTEIYAGLPTNNIIIKSLTTTNVIVDVKDISHQFFIKNKRESLSVISQYIYGILTLNQVFGDVEILLYILTILDIFFTIIYILIAIIFIYPYLIIIWIIICGNIFCAYKANTTKEFVVNTKTYYLYISETAVKVYNATVSLIIYIIQTIRQMFQI